MLSMDRWVKKHPEWFEHSRIEIEKGHEGWRQLIDNAFTAAEHILSEYPFVQFRIVQVKEKLGTLRVYFRGEGLPAEILTQLWDIMQAATNKSSSVCEICGAPARLGKRHGRVMVRCQSCAPNGWVPMIGPHFC